MDHFFERLRGLELLLPALAKLPLKYPNVVNNDNNNAIFDLLNFCIEITPFL